MRNKFTFVDLFAGIGGFRIALESFGGKCVFTSEWDKYAAATYKENFGEEPEGDITKIKAKDIQPHDVLCAGFPCQAFSISGKQKGFNDTRGTLFFDICRIADYRSHRPKVLFLENVKNLASHNGGRTLSTIIRTLNDINYDVFFEVLDSSRFGVAQARKRVYFVCFRKDLSVKSFVFPQSSGKPVGLKDIIEPNSKTKDYIIKRDDIKINKKTVKERSIFGDYSLKPIRVGTINNGGQGERIYSEYGHAITLSAYGGGAAAKTGAYLINDKIRQLSPRECLRVLGFPEWFKFLKETKVHQAYKQCGNSVVVPVLKAIFEEILKKGVL
jgi:DNA (cytosine-5)-methyltransferase 1